HAVVKRMGSECLEAFLKEFAVLQSAYEAHVGHRMNKGLRVFDGSLFHQIGPELAGQIELGIHLESLRNVDASVRFLRSVVQLTKRGVASSRIVPRIRTFLGCASQNFMELYFQARIEFFQEYGEGGAHDTCTDQNDIQVRRTTCFRVTRANHDRV